MSMVNKILQYLKVPFKIFGYLSTNYPVETRHDGAILILIILAIIVSIIKPGNFWQNFVSEWSK